MAVISTVFLCNTSLHAQDSSKTPPKAFSKEQIAKQNILTLFRWIENGSFEKAELKNATAVIKRQLKILKKECVLGKKICASVYGCLDSAFFNALVKGYEFEGDNRTLLNRLFIAAGGNTDTAVPRHPWLDIKNSLLNCLENESIISCNSPTEKAKTDLTKPEILVAPSIDSVACLVEQGFALVLKTKLNLSGTYRLLHKGSTSRGTSLDNTDFDFDLVFEKQEDVDKTLKKLNPALKLIFKEWKSQGYGILSRYERQVLTKRLINLIVLDKNGVVFMMQIFVGKNFVIYVDRLNAQIEQIKALGGSWKDLSGQIILFKRLVRDVLHSYRQVFGGIDGMGCEQFIIQAASSSGYGRKITSIGSFDKTLRWVYDIGFDQTSSTIIPFDKATSRTGIYYLNTKNIVPLVCAPAFWDKLINAARKYVKLAKTEMSEDEFASLGH